MKPSKQDRQRRGRHEQDEKNHGRHARLHPGRLRFDGMRIDPIRRNGDTGIHGRTGDRHATAQGDREARREVREGQSKHQNQTGDWHFVLRVRHQGPSVRQQRPRHLQHPWMVPRPLRQLPRASAEPLLGEERKPGDRLLHQERQGRVLRASHADGRHRHHIQRHRAQESRSRPVEYRQLG